MVLKLTKETFSEQIKQGVALVDFGAPWCAPCRMLDPIINELAVEFESSATIAKVNVDDQPELASRFSVMGLPTVILFKDGTPVDALRGLQSKDVLKSSLLSQLG
ncbi:thioredoxin [Brevibacillus ginsengisoli]|uniref:thioredoxin n=1 Tax=Brevibacillus ginsengisoli TaxID=363854 RepID=UPI003CEE521B